MIETLNHLPHPHESAAALAGHFTDLAPPLNARQAHLEASRCLYCYDAPCVNACPSEIDIPSFIRNIHQDNVPGAAQKILSANILGGSCAGSARRKSSVSKPACATTLRNVRRC